MTKFSIFSLSAGIIWCVCMGAALAQAPDTDAQLRAKKIPHEQALGAIERERIEFLRVLAEREQNCFKRFFSARCLDQVTIDHLNAMRGFDLQREEQRQALREIDAQLRARGRERRANQS